MVDGDDYFDLYYPAGSLQFGYTKNVGERFIYIMGTLTGGYDAEHAIKLTWTNNDYWFTTLSVIAGRYKYKYVIADEGCTNIDWDTLNKADRWINIE